MVRLSSSDELMAGHHESNFPDWFPVVWIVELKPVDCRGARPCAPTPYTPSQSAPNHRSSPACNGKTGIT